MIYLLRIWLIFCAWSPTIGIRACWRRSAVERWLCLNRVLEVLVPDAWFCTHSICVACWEPGWNVVWIQPVLICRLCGGATAWPDSIKCAEFKINFWNVDCQQRLISTWTCACRERWAGAALNALQSAFCTYFATLPYLKVHINRFFIYNVLKRKNRT